MPLLRLTGAEQDLEVLLDIIHEVFHGIGIVQEILADDKLDWLLGVNALEGYLVPLMDTIIVEGALISARY